MRTEDLERACPRCGALNRDGDSFCDVASCGAFLGWSASATALQRAESMVEATVGATHTPTSVGRGLAPETVIASIRENAEVLRRRLAAAEADDALVSITMSDTLVEVEPGEEATCEVVARNRGTVVDRYTIEILGPASSWTVADPAQINVYPGTVERSVIRFRAPRSPAVRAGRYATRVRVTSYEDAAVRASAKVTCRVLPFREMSADVVPASKAARFRTRHRFKVTNEGNVPLRATVVPTDPNEALKFAVDAPAMVIAPGASLEKVITVRPRRWRLLGFPTTHHFLVAAPPATDAAARGEMVQRALLPRWMPRWLTFLVPLALIVVALLLLFAFVPDVVDQPQQAALAALSAKGFKPMAIPRADDTVEPGTVISTEPRGGSPARRGSRVKLLVSRGSPIAVPNVVGLDANVANATVLQTGLATKLVTQYDQSVPDLVIGTQPAPNTLVARGTPVSVIVSAGPEPLPTPAPAPAAGAGSAAAPEAKVTELAISAAPGIGYVRCPVSVGFSGEITVAGAAATVSYRFERSDGFIEPAQQLVFSRPGKQEVASTWTVGAPGRSASGTVKLHVTAPQDLSSQPATTSIRCRPAELTDFARQGRAQPAVFRPSDGTWLALNKDGAATALGRLGSPGDIALPADYDGDGSADIGVWHPNNGTWTHVRSHDGNEESLKLGQAGDVPLPADYDGDGKADPAVWHPSTGAWTISQSSDKQDRIVVLGKPDDLPVPADYDGDGKTDPAVWRPSDSSWLRALSTEEGKPQTVRASLQGDVPVPADYDGDGRADLALWRSSDGTFSITRSSDGKDRVVKVGASGDAPVPADFDGDGLADPAVWRASGGVWAIRLSADPRDGPTTLRLGADGDTPLR